jgi:hypothetical protein
MAVSINGTTGLTGVAAIDDVSSTELGYLDGVTSAIQGQLDGKQAAASTGLALITTQSFSAVSSVSINNCFSADYDNYRVMFSLTATSGNASAYVRLRAGGSDWTTSRYYQMSPGLTSGNSVSSNGSEGQSGWEWGTIDPPGIAVMNIDVMSPAMAVQTRIAGTSAYYNGSFFVGRALMGVHNSSTSIDGISFYPGSGNYTGSLSIYGYGKAL